MNAFDSYIILIFVVKVCFIILSSYHVYLQAKGEGKSKRAQSVLFWKERFEFIFIALMSILLVYLFSPRNNRIGLIDNETKLLLYLFGFVLLMTADWRVFFGTSPAVKIIQSIIGR